MRFDWLTWSNPVAIWWGFLVIVSTVNVALFILIYCYCGGGILERQRRALRIDLMTVLCAAYVLGCAFRAALPRADVQRICLFDTWFSSILVGRSVATIAEVCFAAQWAIVLRLLARAANSNWTRYIANAIMPLILLAECCSWYAVVTTSYLGNAFENSLWTLTFALIAGAMLRLWHEFSGIIRFFIAAAVAGIASYLVFMLTVDVPMYLDRWVADLSRGKELLGLFAGLRDVSTRWAVTRDIAEWRNEIAWMTLYFSIAVWTSLALCSLGLLKAGLAQYCRRPSGWRFDRGRLAIVDDRCPIP